MRVLAENRREPVERIITALLHQFPLGYLSFISSQAVAPASGQGMLATQP
jgi:hypothetical protein